MPALSPLQIAIRDKLSAQATRARELSTDATQTDAPPRIELTAPDADALVALINAYAAL